MDKDFINRIVNDMMNDTEVWFETHSYGGDSTYGTTYFYHPYLNPHLCEIPSIREKEAVYVLFGYRYDFKKKANQYTNTRFISQYLSQVYGIKESELEYTFKEYRKLIYKEQVKGHEKVKREELMWS